MSRAGPGFQREARAAVKALEPRVGGWGHGQVRGRERPLPGPRRQDGTYTVSMNGIYVVAASFQTETVGRVFPELGTIRRVSEGGLL